LGLGYGLAVEVPYSQADNRDDLSAEQQQELVASFYPRLDVELTKVIDWLNSGKIILTGNKEQYNHCFDYVVIAATKRKSQLLIKLLKAWETKLQLTYRV
jgi:hypothetical protein